MIRRPYALLVAYDGAPFKGWQTIPGLPTVCGELTGALRQVGIGATPFGASRTDAGVHARAQVVSFHSRGKLDTDALALELNRWLPSEIRVLAFRAAPKSFHAHWSSTGKRYRYRIAFRDEPRAWRLPAEHFPIEALDRALLEEVLTRLVECEDLSALSAERVKKPRRLTRAAVLACDTSGLTLEVEGPGFGKYMVRNLVSLAASIAGGVLPRQALEPVLAGEQRRPFKAAAGGLTLWQVLYPPELDPFPDLERICG